MKCFLLWIVIISSLLIVPTHTNALWGIKVVNNSNLPGWTVPAGVGGVEVLSFDIIAWPRDVEIFSFYLKRRGLSDEDTITWVSAFSNGIKISDNEDENNGNDDELDLEIADTFIVPSGTTKTVSIVANVASIEDVPNVSNNEFTFDLLIIRTPDGSQRVSWIKGSSYRVGWVSIGNLEFIPDDPIERIRLSKQNRIFEFDLEAPEDSDITLEGIRLRTTYDELDNDLEKIVLALDSKIISKAQIHDEYITFIFQDPLFLQEWKRETFTIAARVKSRVDEELEFFLDGAEDLIYIDENQGTKTGFLREIKSPVIIPDDGSIATDTGDIISPQTLEAVNAYIARIESKSDDNTTRVQTLSKTIIALQWVATTRFEYRDVIAGIIFLLREKIESY